MASQSTQPPVIDIELIRQQFGDDTSLLREVIGDYSEQRVEIVGHIHQAFERGDLDAVAEHTHQLKGSLLTLGAQAAAQIASELESAARSGDAGAARALLPRLESALDTLAPELERLL